MRVAALIAAVALLASAAEAGEVGRFRPATPGYVVLKVPASASNDPIALLEQQHAREPQDEVIASQLADLYLRRARADREPRYFARAEALLRPWASLQGARGATLRVQADILQNRHDFASAVKLLDRAIALDPRDASARLMRASVKMVGGHAADARSDCAGVLASGESTSGTICLAQVLGATGGLARADALLKTLVSREETAPAATASAPVRAWALWLLADFADRSGDSRAAEAQLRAALEADPQNEGIRSALSDLLLNRGASREALALVDLPAPSIGLLARRARAQQLLRDPALEGTRTQIKDLVTLASRRGDPPHLREEALVALDIDRDAPRALELAKANFDTQRETLDVRLLIRAARACGDTATLRSVAEWIHQTGYEDRQLPGRGHMSREGAIRRPSFRTGWRPAGFPRAAAVFLLIAAALVLGAPGKAEAHFTSTSYLTADTSQAGDARITWDVSAADLHWSLGLDADGNGTITWEEIQSRRDDIASFATEHLSVARGGQACDTHFADLLLTEHAGEPHLSLDFRARCATAGALSLSGTLFFDTNTTQRTLLGAVTPAGEFTSILSPDSPNWTEPPAPSVLATFGTFVGQGLWHVWIGYDHLAFLLLLLLPGVLRAAGMAGWQPVPTFRETARDLLRIITAFTLAHSLTLALAATGTVTLPVRPVEVAIAASIVIAGLLNLFPRAARARLALAFGFGLVHGFGFANALAELGARGARLVPTLAGFNVGVELAQLSLVLLVLPFLFRARNSAFYAWRFMPAASLGAAMAGAAWLVARAN